MIAYDVLVDPDRMLRVRFVDAQGNERNVNALTCSYVPAPTHAGTVGVAVQVVVDPAVPAPQQAYYCAPARLQHHLLAPGKLRGVSPYRRQ